MWLRTKDSWQSPGSWKRQVAPPSQTQGTGLRYFVFVFCLSETKSQYVVLAVLELMAILLPELPKDWNYRCEPPCSAWLWISVFRVVREHSSAVSVTLGHLSQQPGTGQNRGQEAP